MTSLAPLHARLTALVRRRRLARLATACGAAALIALVSLWMLFVSDWACQWGRGPRLFGLSLAAAALLLVARGLLARAAAARETETDVALAIERRQQLDSDLVASLQFEPPSAAAWGSRSLELAIVEYVAHFSETLRVAPQRPKSVVWAGGLLLALMVFASAGGIATYPDHAAAFVDRALLGTSHYPTRTKIVSIAINGRAAGPAASMRRSADGEPVRIDVYGEGALPRSGLAVFTAVPGGETSSIELFRGDEGHYVGRLPRLVNSVQYQIRLGDAWTEKTGLVAAPSPVISLSLRPRSPDDAASHDSGSDAETGSRQISVLEGSRVELEVVCRNKELEQATIELGRRKFKLEPGDDSRRRWRLNVPGTPFERVTDTLRFSISVTDADGLGLPEPLEGAISVAIDQPPRVTATAVTQDLLPTARPTIYYAARDDYALAGLWMRRELLRPGEPASEDRQEISLGPSPSKSIEGTLTLELGALRLVKGDQLRITFEAIDIRAAGVGKTTASEPLVLRVTDARGVLAAMADADEGSEEELEGIIERQLGPQGKP